MRRSQRSGTRGARRPCSRRRALAGEGNDHGTANHCRCSERRHALQRGRARARRRFGWHPRAPAEVGGAGSAAGPCHSGCPRHHPRAQPDAQPTRRPRSPRARARSGGSLPPVIPTSRAVGSRPGPGTKISRALSPSRSRIPSGARTTALPCSTRPESLPRRSPCAGASPRSASVPSRTSSTSRTS